MKAPTSHMIKATPTLPDEWRMLLGVAYILIHGQICSYSWLIGIDSAKNAPASNHAVEDKKSGTEEACSFYFWFQPL